MAVVVGFGWLRKQEEERGSLKGKAKEGGMVEEWEQRREVVGLARLGTRCLTVVAVHHDVTIPML